MTVGITELLRLSRRQIRLLFDQRQARSDAHRTSESETGPAKNEEIEVPSPMAVSVADQLAAIQAEYLRREQKMGVQKIEILVFRPLHFSS